MADRIERDAFLFLAPKNREEEFAQCGPCRMFVPEKYLSGMSGDRCIIHGSQVKIDDDDSCGFMCPWPTADWSAVDQVIRDHAAELMKNIPGSVSPEESGLVSRRVQCHRCRFADEKVEACGLYAALNDAFPDMFDLDVEIEAHSCCNGQMPKASDEDYQNMSPADRMAYARSAAVKTRKS